MANFDEFTGKYYQNRESAPISGDALRGRSSSETVERDRDRFRRAYLEARAECDRLRGRYEGALSALSTRINRTREEVENYRAWALAALKRCEVLEATTGAGLTDDIALEVQALADRYARARREALELVEDMHRNAIKGLSRLAQSTIEGVRLERAACAWLETVEAATPLVLRSSLAHIGAPYRGAMTTVGAWVTAVERWRSAAGR